MPAQAQSSPARSATAPVRTTQSLRSLNEERPPAGGQRWVVSDPVAYRQAVKTQNWVHTPYGLSYKTCVYRAPNHAVVRKSEIVAPSGVIQRITPCMHPTLSYPGSARPSTLGHSMSEPGPTRVATTGGPCGFGKGGVYWAASCYGSAPDWVTSFDQEYAVPTNPAKDGALIFLWGGMRTRRATRSSRTC